MLRSALAAGTLLIAGACTTTSEEAKAEVDAVVIDERARAVAADAARSGQSSAEALDKGEDASTREPATPRT